MYYICPMRIRTDSDHLITQVIKEYKEKYNKTITKEEVISILEVNFIYLDECMARKMEVPINRIGRFIPVKSTSSYIRRKDYLDKTHKRFDKFLND